MKDISSQRQLLILGKNPHLPNPTPIKVNEGCFADLTQSAGYFTPEFGRSLSYTEFKSRA